MEDNRIFQDILDLNLQYHCEDREDIRQRILSYNEGVSAQAMSILRDAVVIDACSFAAERDNWALQASGVTAFGCAFPGMDTANEAMRATIDHYHVVRRHGDRFMIAYTPEDLLKAKEQGKYALILSSRSCDFASHSNLFATSLIAANMGLRLMALAHTHSNFTGDSCLSPANCGITREGRTMVKALERFGITVDLSGSSQRTALEALDLCQKPAVFSSTNPRVLFDHPANISDDLIRKCAEKGGVICASAVPAMLWNGKDFPTVESLADSIVYLAELVGIGHVGIGLGASAQPGGAPRREVTYLTELELDCTGADSLARRSYEAGRGHLSCFTEGAAGMVNLPNITQCLLRRGLSEEDIRKVLGGNLLRVFRETWL